LSRVWWVCQKAQGRDVATKAPTIRAVLDADTQTLDGWSALAQREGESDKAHTAFLEYVRMGPLRSLQKLHEEYCAQGESRPSPPTRRLATLKKWSLDYEWQTRLAAYKQERDARDQVIWEERRRALQEADFATVTPCVTWLNRCWSTRRSF